MHDQNTPPRAAHTRRAAAVVAMEEYRASSPQWRRELVGRLHAPADDQAAGGISTDMLVKTLLGHGGRAGPEPHLRLACVHAAHTILEYQERLAFLVHVLEREEKSS